MCAVDIIHLTRKKVGVCFFFFFLKSMFVIGSQNQRISKRMFFALSIIWKPFFQRDLTSAHTDWQLVCFFTSASFRFDTHYIFLCRKSLVRHYAWSPSSSWKQFPRNHIYARLRLFKLSARFTLLGKEKWGKEW